MANEPASLQTTAGWDALRAARWREATAAFHKALAYEESGEAWEGLSWAAWWLDDAETVFQAREQAYRLYRRAGATNAAARMATWLASDALDFHGAPAVASGWLLRAHRLLDPLEPSPEHGWLAFHDGYVERLRNETASSLELARRAAEIGRQFNVPDLEMLGLALEGATLVDCAEVEHGMRSLDEAAAIALQGDAEIPISGAWTCCFLVTTCAAVCDYARASEWCDRIAAFADRYGSRYMLAFCRAEYGAVHLWRGDWDEAERLLSASIDDFSSSRPGWSSPSLVGLAEVRRRRGAIHEAEEFLERAGSGEAAQLCRARIALDRDRPGDAALLLERVLRQMEDRRLQRGAALELLVRARLVVGEPEHAQAAAEDLYEIATLVGTPALHASAAAARGVVAAAYGDHGLARRHLEDAVDGFDSVQAPYEAAKARIELATILVQLREDDAAQGEARMAHVTLARLGSPLAEAARRMTDVPSVVTPRERDVLRLLARGLTNRQIADELVVSEHTVHRHVTNILRKLDVPTRTAAVAYAVSAGLTGHSGDALAESDHTPASHG